MDALPKDGLFRSSPGLELREVAGATMPRLTGYAIRFNEPTEIHSFFEGDFIERIAPGATRKTLAAIGRRPEFGINFDPSHFAHQFLDSAAFVQEFADRIYHVHVKDSRRTLDGRKSILGGHLNFGEAERGWDFVSPGHGDVDFESLFRALNRIGYDGPLSIEWEDSGMDRDWGAPAALARLAASRLSRRYPPRRRSPAIRFAPP